MFMWIMRLLISLSMLLRKIYKLSYVAKMVGPKTLEAGTFPCIYSRCCFADGLTWSTYRVSTLLHME